MKSFAETLFVLWWYTFQIIIYSLILFFSKIFPAKGPIQMSTVHLGFLFWVILSTLPVFYILCPTEIKKKPESHQSRISIHHWVTILSQLESVLSSVTVAHVPWENSPVIWYKKGKLHVTSWLTLISVIIEMSFLYWVR